MNLLEKREYIYSHLHQLDEELVDEMFDKMFSLIEQNDPIVGHDTKTGEALTKKSYINELNKRNADIDNGNYILHRDARKEAKNW